MAKSFADLKAQFAKVAPSKQEAEFSLQVLLGQVVTDPAQRQELVGIHVRARVQTLNREDGAKGINDLRALYDAMQASSLAPDLPQDFTDIFKRALEKKISEAMILIFGLTSIGRWEENYVDCALEALKDMSQKTPHLLPADIKITLIEGCLNITANVAEGKYGTEQGKLREIAQKLATAAKEINAKPLAAQAAVTTGTAMSSDDVQITVKAPVHFRIVDVEGKTAPAPAPAAPAPKV